MSEEKLSAIVGFRVPPSWKAAAEEEAKERGQTLSAFIWDLIWAGFEKIYMQDVTHGRQNETLPNDDKGDAV